MILPIVSIGVCVKNAEATIKKAIESILKQDYPHKFLELIVVDGYSIDRTVSIIKRTLSRSDINYRIFYENKGLGNARQIVLERSKGKYVLWVDSDVILDTDYVRKQVYFMEKNPEVVAASGKFSRIEANGIVSKLENIDWMVGDYVKSHLPTMGAVRVCCAGTIFRKSAIKKIGGFDREIKGACEDIDLAYRMQKAGWTIHFVVNTKFRHLGRGDLKSVFKENFWYGYGGHYIMHKYYTSITSSSLTEMFTRFVLAYRLARDKIVFLFPAIYIFKKVAWLCGFTKAHIDGYGHGHF